MVARIWGGHHCPSRPELGKPNWPPSAAATYNHSGTRLFQHKRFMGQKADQLASKFCPMEHTRSTYGIAIHTGAEIDRHLSLSANAFRMTEA
jgi:hypothetical protein